jgi:hypothetical protein
MANRKKPTTPKPAADPNKPKRRRLTDEERTAQEAAEWRVRRAAAAKRVDAIGWEMTKLEAERGSLERTISRANAVLAALCPEDAQPEPIGEL